MMQLLNSSNLSQKPYWSKTKKSMSDLFFSETEFAIVLEAISANHRGRINYQGTSWFAYSLSNVPIPVGAPVEVIQLKGNTWLVKPVDSLVNFTSAPC